jgi:hypothetical protein
MPNRGEARQFSERDREVVRFIGWGGVASLAQLHAKFWLVRQLSTCRSRLLQLEKVGWLESRYSDVLKPTCPQLIFSITPKAAANFSADEHSRMLVGLPASHELKQQLIAQTARLRLEQDLAEQGQRVVEWLNEHDLRREYATIAPPGQSRQTSAVNYHQIGAAHSEGIHSLVAEIADARAIIVDRAGRHSAIDIEIDGYYYGRMLDEKLAGLERSPRPVIYVTWQSRADHLKAALQAYPNLHLLVI